MDIIFNLKDDTDWASTYNDQIKRDYPEFFANSPLIGSEEWWATIECDVSKGRITDIGKFVEDGELLDLVTILPLDGNLEEEALLQQLEYSVHREDFWLHDAVKKDKFVQIKSVTICPTGELDENSIYLETEVCIW